MEPSQQPGTKKVYFEKGKIRSMPQAEPYRMANAYMGRARARTLHPACSHGYSSEQVLKPLLGRFLYQLATMQGRQLQPAEAKSVATGRSLAASEVYRPLMRCPTQAAHKCARAPDNTAIICSCLCEYLPELLAHRSIAPGTRPCRCRLGLTCTRNDGHVISSESQM